MKWSGNSQPDSNTTYLQDFLLETPRIVKVGGDVAKAVFSMAVAAYEKRDFEHARVLWMKHLVVLRCTNHGTQRFFEALTPEAEQDPELKKILERYMNDLTKAKGNDGLYSVLAENCTLALKRQS